MPLSVPRTERQIISFNCRSSTASSFVKFIFRDAALRRVNGLTTNAMLRCAEHQTNWQSAT